MKGRVVVSALVCGSILMASGCSLMMPSRIAAVPTQHIVMVDTDGRVADPTGNVLCHSDRLVRDNKQWNTDPRNATKVRAPERLGEWAPCNGRLGGLWLRNLNYPLRDGRTATDAYLDDLFAAMDDFYRTQPTKHGHQIRRLVIIIHGGLNDNKNTIRRAQDLAQKIRDEGGYPVFINWQSNLPRSLSDQVGAVRQGDNVGYFRGALLSAPYFIADLGRGVARAPIIWWESFKNDADRIRRALGAKVPVLKSPEESAAEAQYKAILDERKPGSIRTPLDVEMQGSEYSIVKDGVSSTATYVTFGLTPFRVIWRQQGFRSVMRLLGFAPQLHFLTYLPTKYLAAPFLDGLGTPAWDEMKRAAVLGFHSDGRSASHSDSDEARYDKVGGISKFFNRLRQRISETHCAAPASDASGVCAEWEIDLIGHSMGAIVANHVLRNHGDIEFRNIVYMAAACSVREYEDAVLPYLSRHCKTQMYHVTLHPFAEVREEHVQELPPSGSLLVWIDNFFTTPATLRDRTAGRFENLIRFIDETPEELHMRARIHVKSFGLGGKYAVEHDPQQHGQFFDGVMPRTKASFWESAFWETSNPPPSQSAATSVQSQ